MKKTVTITIITLISCLMLRPVTDAIAGSAYKMYLFAAASTTDAVAEISRLYEQDHLVEIIPSFASSSTLAKQINLGAPAAVFISANPNWMDFLEKNHQLAPGSRMNLMGNRIVLIAPMDSGLELTIDKGLDLSGILGSDRLAMGDPDHVPAGIYGKKALEFLGVWSEVASKVARAKDVRAALVLVERSEAPLGIVYATDAALSKKVKVIGTFPEESHPPIIYPAALISGQDLKTGADFLLFLKTPEAKRIFEKFGFSIY